MKLLNKWMQAFGAMLLTASLFAIPAFAHEAATAAEETKKLSTEQIVWLIVGGVALVAAVVLGIIFREKIAKFFRVYNSERKKIVWLPWDQTKKSTWVVLVVLVVAAAAICLLDFGLFKGITKLVDWLGNMTFATPAA